ncbi:MAG: NAD(P)H-hydrate dehydratase [Dehalococcoidales bacterium]|nr:NAD(P)H-hydrate dehydratase [Dehalococcoidales bacterium]
MKILTAEQMRRIDAECIAGGTPGSVLMENAGMAVAEEIQRIYGDVTGKKVVILSGPGNNGGDGLVAARYLHERKAEVCLFVLGKKRENDANLELVKLWNIVCIEPFTEDDIPALEEALKKADIVVDSVFGTGNNRPIEGVFKKALETVRTEIESRPEIHTFAVDIPSGLNADTGAVDEACLSMDDTITLACPKIGLYHMPGSEKAGRITITDIGIPESLSDDISLELNTPQRVAARLLKRPLAGNKGTFGKVLVIAGSINYIGAAYLACSGAIRSGAGLVTLATPAGLQPVLASKMAEVTYLPLPEAEHGVISPEAAGIVLENINDYDVMLIGCGLGQTLSVRDFIITLLTQNGKNLPLAVIDADALNTLAGVPEWWQRFAGNAILTPHPGEMSRLTGKDVKDIQRNRLTTAEEAAARWNRTVVLKGAYTVITSPGCSSVINPAANPGLASAGTGDVLAGVIAGMVAQGISPADAAACGVFIHSTAGQIVMENLGDCGMIASDLLPVLPLAINEIKNSIR